MISNSFRKIAGVHIRFCPPGHWSLPNSIGQFSMATLTLFSSARAMIGGQISLKSSMFSSTVFA